MLYRSVLLALPLFLIGCNASDDNETTTTTPATGVVIRPSEPEKPPVEPTPAPNPPAVSESPTEEPTTSEEPVAVITPPEEPVTIEQPPEVITTPEPAPPAQEEEVFAEPHDTVDEHPAVAEIPIVSNEPEQPTAEAEEPTTTDDTQPSVEEEPAIAVDLAYTDVFAANQIIAVTLFLQNNTEQDIAEVAGTVVLSTAQGETLAELDLQSHDILKNLNRSWRYQLDAGERKKWGLSIQEQQYPDLYAFLIEMPLEDVRGEFVLAEQ